MRGEDPELHRTVVAWLPPAQMTVYDLLTHQPEPCSAATLATHLHQHPNTLREHLGRLVDAGLVERTPSHRNGRGRPPWLYSVIGRAGPKT